MGNFQFGIPSNMHPRPGQILVVKDSQYTRADKYPNEILFQGQQVQVLGTKNLLKSRPTAPDITCSMIKFKNGHIDTYFTNNLV